MMSITLSGGLIIIEIRFAAIKYITIVVIIVVIIINCMARDYYIGDVPDNGVETFSI